MEMTLSTAYFNLNEDYENLILSNRTYPLTIIHPSPQACGFYGAGRLLGHVPSLYVHNAHEFMLRTTFPSTSKKAPVRMMEYERPGWTFHSKGIWAERKDRKLAATVIGSSNYGA